MADPARKVAQQAEGRLEEVAETVRRKFDALTGVRFGGKGRTVQSRDTARQEPAEAGRTVPPPKTDDSQRRDRRP